MAGASRPVSGSRNQSGAGLTGASARWNTGHCPPSKRAAAATVAVYSMTVRWSGFSLMWPLTGTGSGQDGGSCIVSGATTFQSGDALKVIVWQPHAGTALDIYLYPDGHGDPGYVFRFR